MSDMHNFVRTLTRDKLMHLDYRQLQQIAKVNGIPCNIKRHHLEEAVYLKYHGTRSEVVAVLATVTRERMAEKRTKEKYSYTARNYVNAATNEVTTFSPKDKSIYKKMILEKIKKKQNDSEVCKKFTDMSSLGAASSSKKIPSDVSPHHNVSALGVMSSDKTIPADVSSCRNFNSPHNVSSLEMTSSEKTIHADVSSSHNVSSLGVASFEKAVPADVSSLGVTSSVKTVPADVSSLGVTSSVKTVPADVSSLHNVSSLGVISSVKTVPADVRSLEVVSSEKTISDDVSSMELTSSVKAEPAEISSLYVANSVMTEPADVNSLDAAKSVKKEAADVSSLDARNSVKTVPADVDYIYSLEDETVVKEEMNIESTVIRPPDFCYWSQKCKEEPIESSASGYQDAEVSVVPILSGQLGAPRSFAGTVTQPHHMPDDVSAPRLRLLLTAARDYRCMSIKQN